MSVPKSVIKVNKKGIQYVSNVDACNYYIFELTRGALRDIGKLIAVKFRQSFYSNFKRVSGDAGRATKYKVFSSKNTKYPRVQIGLKTGRVDGFYAYFQEFGTDKQPKLGLLDKSARENADEIRKIQAQYLSAISKGESAAKSLIDENDMEGDGN